MSAKLSLEQLDQIAAKNHEQVMSAIEGVVRIVAPDLVSAVVRNLMHHDPRVRNEIVHAVREEARDLLAAFKTAAPNGPVISRSAVVLALKAAGVGGLHSPPAEHVNAACESLKKNGYFVI